MPEAARTPAPPSIRQRYEPLATPVASHVQSTVGPSPANDATSKPAASVTAMRQGSADESLARKRTALPTEPVTRGS